MFQRPFQRIIFYYCLEAFLVSLQLVFEEKQAKKIKLACFKTVETKRNLMNLINILKCDQQLGELTEVLTISGWYGCQDTSRTVDPCLSSRQTFLMFQL